MRSKILVEADVFLHRPMQVALVQSEPVIEALSLQASNETLANGIRPRRPDWCLHILDACTPGDRQEWTAVLFITAAWTIRRVFSSMMMKMQSGRKSRS
jgi:hypothetical protein